MTNERRGYYLDWHLVTMLLGHLVTLGHWHLDSYRGAVAVGDLQCVNIWYLVFGILYLVFLIK